LEANGRHKSGKNSESRRGGEESTLAFMRTNRKTKDLGQKDYKNGVTSRKNSQGVRVGEKGGAPATMEGGGQMANKGMLKHVQNLQRLKSGMGRRGSKTQKKGGTMLGGGGRIYRLDKR